MGLFKTLFGKHKIDRKAVQYLGMQAIQSIEGMLNESEIKALFDKIEKFYSDAKMWPSGFKSIEEFEIYLIVLSKYISIYIQETFNSKFNTDELIRLSQSTVLVELGSIFNSQKKSPNSDIAFRLSQLITKQELAMQSSYIIASESDKLFNTEKAKLQKLIGLLADGKVMQIMQEEMHAAAEFSNT